MKGAHVVIRSVAVGTTVTALISYWITQGPIRTNKGMSEPNRLGRTP